MKSNDEQLASLAKEFFTKVQGDDQLQQLLQGFTQDKIQHHPHTFHSHAFGDGTYSKQEIEQAHKNISINQDHFNSMIDHFIHSLDSHGYGEEDKKIAVETLLKYKDIVLEK